MSKRPKINNELHKPIQEYANKHHDGNFTEAVNSLLMLSVSYRATVDGICTDIEMKDYLAGDPLTFPEVLDGPK